ncbi:hypothetical protein ACIGFL_14455 [Pseudomonas sp. NPDC077649]|uniref:hypothetical protein n=1 Tax=Pseudomonas sp. NPDC077649 TaxID=3364423 RepID=UPI0037CB7E8D
MKRLKEWCELAFVALASLLWVLLTEKPYRRRKWRVATAALLLVGAIYLVMQGA